DLQIVDGKDVRVIEAAHDAGLLDELRDRLGVPLVPGLLQSRPALEEMVPHRAHAPHSAARDLPAVLEACGAWRPVCFGLAHRYESTKRHVPRSLLCTKDPEGRGRACNAVGVLFASRPARPRSMHAMSPAAAHGTPRQSDPGPRCCSSVVGLSREDTGAD